MMFELNVNMNMNMNINLRMIKRIIQHEKVVSVIVNRVMQVHIVENVIVDISCMTIVQIMMNIGNVFLVQLVIIQVDLRHHVQLVQKERIAQNLEVYVHHQVVLHVQQEHMDPIKAKIH